MIRRWDDGSRGLGIYKEGRFTLNVGDEIHLLSPGEAIVVGEIVQVWDSGEGKQVVVMEVDKE